MTGQIKPGFSAGKKAAGSKTSKPLEGLGKSAKADPSVLSPAALMALGLAGVAVAAVPDKAQNAPPMSKNDAALSGAAGFSDRVAEETAASVAPPIASELQLQLLDLIDDLQAQTVLEAEATGVTTVTSELASPAEVIAPQQPYQADLFAQLGDGAAVVSVVAEPVLLAQASVPAAVPQAAAATAAPAAGAAGAAAAASILPAVLVLGVLGAAAAASSSSSSAAVVVKDTTPPAAPIIGAVATDNIVNATEKASGVTVTGTAEAGASVAVTWGSAVKTVTATGGTWSTSFNSSEVPADASTTISAIATDAAGNASSAGTLAVSVDTVAPAIQLLAATGTATPTTGTIVLTYNGALDAANPPSAASFTVTTGGSNNAVTGVTVAGAVVTLTVSNFAPGAITVAYADPTGNDILAIQDAAGNDAPGFSSGVAADGYLRGASVYIDTNSNGTVDVTTDFLVGTTDASGNFFIPSSAPVGAIMVTGGVNIDTGVANTTVLKAPVGSNTINPLTTLVQAVVQASGGTTSAASAATSVASSLGLTLSDGQSLLSYDPIAAASSTDATIASNALASQKAAAQVATIAALAETASAGAGASVIANLVTVLNTAAASGSAVNLADSSTITSMLGTALDGSSAAVKAQAQSAIADASTAISTTTSLANLSSAQAQALDKIAPGAPTVSAAANTSITTPTVRVSFNTSATDGTAANAGDVLILKDNNVQIGLSATLSAADIAAGYKDVVAATLAEGAHSLSVSITDQAGNASAASATVAVTIDTMVPAAPVISAVATDNTINATEKAAGVTVSGTAESGASVVVSWGTSKTVTATGGTWSTSFSSTEVPADASTTSISAIATDAAGNESTSANRVVAVDTTPSTVATAVTGAADDVDPTIGNVAAGGTSNDNTLGLSGTLSAALAAGDVVAVYDGDSRLGVAEVSGTTWALNTAGLSNATHSFKARVEDAAGNLGAMGTAYTVTVNATLPTATASVSAVALTSNTPTLSGVVTGTLALGDVVRVYDGSTLLGNAEVDGTAWTLTPASALAEGVHSFKAVVQNAGGNQGTASAATVSTVDTTAPAVPTLNKVATDDVVNAAEVGSSITGANEAGATVAVSIGGNVRAAVVSDSTWSYTLVNDDITALGQGAKTLSATQTDTAGNTSSAGSRPITVDTLAPSVSVAAVATDNAINAAELLAGVAISGTTDALARVEITFEGSNGVRNVIANNAGAWTYSLTKADISAMGQGSETFTVKATDAAGNTTADNAVASKTITIDTVAPVLSSYALLAASDSGTSGDGKSNVVAPSLQLSAEAGATLSIDPGTGVYVAAGTGTGALQTLTAGSNYTVDGIYTVRVKATDAAGNVTERSGKYTLDTVAPGQPGLGTSSDTGASASDAITKDGLVKLTGLESYASWQYSLDAGTTWVNGVGSSFSLSGDGAKSVTVRQTDVAGNVSQTSTALAFTLDTTIATPTLSLASDTGSSATDKTTKVSTVAVAGLESGATWQYSSNAGTDWVSGVGSSFSLSGDGAKSVTVRQTDVAGNLSQTSTALAFTLDTTIAAPTLSLTSDTANATDNISSSASLSFSAVASDVTRSFVVDAGSANASYSAPTADGSHTVVVTDTDTAGNVATQTLTFTLDKTAPTISGFSPADDGLSLGLASNLVMSSPEALAKGTGSLSLYKSGNVLVEAIDVTGSRVTLSDDKKSISIDPTADLVKDETYYVKASAGAFTDTAGNPWAGISDATDWNFTGAGATVLVNLVSGDNKINLIESGTAVLVEGTLGAEPAVLAAYKVSDMTALLDSASGTDISLTNLSYTYTSGATAAWSAVLPASAVSGTAAYTLLVSFKGTAGEAANINGDATQVVQVDTVVVAPSLALTTDSGSSTSDKLTNNAALTPSGETGATFEYSANGTSSWSSTAPTPSTGANTVYARQTDSAGNVSVASSAFSFNYDASVPTVSTVAISSATGIQASTLNAGDVVSVTVTLSEATTVATTGGTPQLALNIDGTTVQAAYASGSGSTALVFNYTVLAGQTDPNGISIAANSLSLNGGTLLDAAGNAATLSHSLVADNASYMVDTTAPTATLVAPTSFTGSGGTFTFNFSEAVTGFDATDIVLVGGTAAAVAGSGASYTSVISPTASTTPLAFSLNVPAAAATDAAGNASTAATAFTSSILVGSSANETLTVNDLLNNIFLDAGGDDTVKLSAATGSTVAATDVVSGFLAGDKIDLSAILGSATGGAAYLSSGFADTNAGFIELKNLALVKNSDTTTVTFDVAFDAATLGGSKINGAVIDLAYQYAMVADGGAVSPKYTTTKFVWSTVTPNLSLADNPSGTSPNGKIALLADTGSANPIIITANTSSGVVLSAELTVTGLVNTFEIGLESKASGGATEINTADGKVYGATSDSGGLLALGISKTAGASLGENGALEIVSDTTTLGTVGDNQLRMLVAPYDTANGLTHLTMQYDTNSAYGTGYTTASSVIAIDFVGDVTALLTPASLTFI
jgi:hypothetical protein